MGIGSDRKTLLLEHRFVLGVAVTTRLIIDHLRSARVRRERYVGTWLPEPILTRGGGRRRPPCRDRRLALEGFLVLFGEP